MKKFAPLCLVALLPLVRAQEPTEASAPHPALPQAQTPEREAPKQGRLVPRPAPQTASDTAAWGGPQLAPLAPAGAGGFLGIRMAEDGPRTVVEEVVAGSPAEAAGLAAGDRLLSVAGQPVAGAASVLAALSGRSPGDRVALEVLRGDALLPLEAQLAPRPASAQAPGQSRGEAPGGPRAAPRLEPIPGPALSPGLAPNPQFPGFDQVPDMLRGFFGGGDLDAFGGVDLRGWLGNQERQAKEWQSEVERLFRDLRQDLGRDFDTLRRELEGQGGLGGLGGQARGWLRQESAERRATARSAAIPAEAWADLERRLEPLEDQRRAIAREWAEAHGNPDWAESVPRLGVEVRIERREVQSGS